MTKTPRRKRVTTVAVGQRVYWIDPDRGLASGYGIVVTTGDLPVDDDTVIALKKDDGGEAEVLLHELRSDDRGRR